MKKEQIINSINLLLEKGEEVLKTKKYHNLEFFSGDYVDDDLYNEWKCQIKIFLSSDEKFSTTKEQFDNTHNGMLTNYEISKKYISMLKGLYNSIENNIILFDKENLPNNQIDNCVFVGHGHSNLWNEVVRFLRDDLELENVNYFERDSHVGRSIADALRNFQNETNFAIIVMTAEDETAQNTKRTRQNVIHEIGFFQGKLGFEKVAILKQNGVESFSNIDGIQYIEFNGNNINQTFYELHKMLKRENVIS